MPAANALQPPVPAEDNSNLLSWLWQQRTKGDAMGWSNPVGTERVGGDTSLTMPGPDVSPVIGSLGGHPVTAQMHANALALAGAMSQFGPADVGAIRAFHGPPADFNAFSNKYIGTGEGAQAYGYGHYAAGSEGVARSYRDKLATGSLDNLNTTLSDFSPYTPGGPTPTVTNLQAVLANHPGPVLKDAAANPAVMRDITTMVNGHDLPSNTWSDEAVKAAGRLDTHFRAQPAAGKMYELNIAADPEHMLDWDKPLSEQSPHVQDALTPQGLGLTPAGPFPGPKGYYGHVDASGKPVGNLQTNAPPKQLFSSQETGMNVVKRLHDGPAQAAKMLQAAGIPGIKYLDQGSRAAGQGTSNYVIFDPATIEILRKYGIGGLIAGGGAAAATSGQDQGQ